MIHGYGLWKEVERRLHIDLPSQSLRNMQKYNQIKQAIGKGWIAKEEVLFFLRFSTGDQKLQDLLEQEGYNLFPNPTFSRFIRNREFYLPQIDVLTKYPLKRLYLEKTTQLTIPTLNRYFGSFDVVIKVGNLHASEGKWLIDNKRILPHLKYKQKLLPLTIEEFVPNARSIRVGLIGNPNKEENYFITEHINSKTWLKNNAPEEENTYSYQNRYQLDIPHIDDLINETRYIALRYRANLLGVDWVISPTRTGLLELNDMIGLPDGDFAFNLFYREIRRICDQSKLEG